MAAEPEGIGRCTDCGSMYAIYRNNEGWHAIGTDGSCQCGNDEFAALSFSETADPA